MIVSPTMRVMDVVADPEMRAVLEWYGLPTHRAALRLSLEDYCEAYSFDLDELLEELRSYTPDDEEDEVFALAWD